MYLIATTSGKYIVHLWNCDIMTQHNEYYSFQLWSVISTCVEKRKVREQDKKKLSHTVVWSNVQMYCPEREMTSIILLLYVYIEF